MHAVERLPPLVYDELRRLAVGEMARDKPGQTLDATALVHEVYLQLVGPADERRWEDCGHFFAAAHIAGLYLPCSRAVLPLFAGCFFGAKGVP
jgi:hypothetical protein